MGYGEWDTGKACRHQIMELRLQCGTTVLLALLEDGTLTEMQYRYAEEKLRKQIF